MSFGKAISSVPAAGESITRVGKRRRGDRREFSLDSHTTAAAPQCLRSILFSASGLVCKPVEWERHRGDGGCSRADGWPRMCACVSARGFGLQLAVATEELPFIARPTTRRTSASAATPPMPSMRPRSSEGNASRSQGTAHRAGLRSGYAAPCRARVPRSLVVLSPILSSSPIVPSIFPSPAVPPCAPHYPISPREALPSVAPLSPGASRSSSVV